MNGTLFRVTVLQGGFTMNMKKLLAGVLAAAMVVGLFPAVAEAKATPTGKALPLTFSAESDTDSVFSFIDLSKKAEEYTFSADLYYPKAAVVEKTTYSVAVSLNVFAISGEEATPCALGSAKATMSVTGDAFTFGGLTDAASIMTGSVVGDYYYIKINSMPIKLTQYAGGSISKFADVPEKVAVFPEIKFSGKASSTTKLYIDNLSIKGGSVKAYVTNFDNGEKDVASDGPGTENDPYVSPVKFAAGKLDVKEKQTVKAGKTLNLGAKADPAGKITYKSSNKKVATVDSKGVVKGIKKGKAKITVTANGQKSVVTVTVK